MGERVALPASLAARARGGAAARPRRSPRDREPGLKTPQMVQRSKWGRYCRESARHRDPGRGVADARRRRCRTRCWPGRSPRRRQGSSAASAGPPATAPLAPRRSCGCRDPPHAGSPAAHATAGRVQPSAPPARIWRLWGWNSSSGSSAGLVERQRRRPRKSQAHIAVGLDPAAGPTRTIPRPPSKPAMPSRMDQKLPAAANGELRGGRTPRTPRSAAPRARCRARTRHRRGRRPTLPFTRTLRPRTPSPQSVRSAVVTSGPPVSSGPAGSRSSARRPADSARRSPSGVCEPAGRGR